MTGEVRLFWRAPRGPVWYFVQGLLVLQAVMLLLLLAVCGNTANLMLARAAVRHREVAVRLTLGASPWHIIRLLLTENLLLGAAGAIGGALLAMWGTNALRAMPLYTGFPIRFQTDIDAVALMFAVALGLVAALAFGGVPAVHLGRLDVSRALHASLQGARHGRLRNALIGIEVALALIVLIAAGLFYRSLTETRVIDPGFRREGVLLAAYDLTGQTVDEREFASTLLRRLRAIPSVEAAAIAGAVPLDIHGLPLRTFTLEGRARVEGAAPDRALSLTVTPDYFAAMDIPMRRGPGFVDLDDRSTEPQAIVNEEFVRRFVGEGEALGRRIGYRDRRYAIAGVVRDSLYESFGEPAKPIIYFSYRDRPSGFGQIHVRTRPGREATLAQEVRRAVRDINPALAINDVRTLTDHVETNLVLRRIPARMFVVLGPLLLVLAAIGIYAVVAYAVAQRTTEIGVRLALGATAGRIVSQIVRETLRPVTVGAITGWLLMLLIYVHLVRGGLDLAVFIGIPIVLFVVATLASWLPARRATAIDPIAALKRASE